MNQFRANKEHLKIAIMDYELFDIDIINFSDWYMQQYWKFLRRGTERAEINDDVLFFERLHRYIFHKKISELLVIMYLLDNKGKTVNIYELNQLLKRTKSKYSATLKEVDKLCRLGILEAEKSRKGRKQTIVRINKDVTLIYGDDEFRQAQVEDWEGTKGYIKGKLKELQEQKEKLIIELDEQTEKMKKARRG